MGFVDDDIRGVRVPHWVPDDGGSANFGDEIGPMLVRALAPEGAEGEGRLLSVGSVIHFGGRGDVVWGAGINGKVRQTLQHPLDVRAVRGPLTRAVLQGHGLEVPEVFGDPALLLPRLFDVPVGTSRDVLVMPNLNELDRVVGDGVVSPLGDPIAIAAEIRAAGFVVASSLHALVIADAFGVPARPLVPGAEHAFKYLDYYAGTGRADVRFAGSVEEALDLGPIGPVDVDLDAIEAAFPRDLWAKRRENDETSRNYDALRRESARGLGALALAVGRDAADPAAQALLRAQLLVAEQPAALAAALERASDGSGISDVSSAAVAFLREVPAHGAMDQRLARALGRRLAGAGAAAGAGTGAAREEIIARVAATGKVSLARAIVDGREELAAGLAHLGEPQPAPEARAQPASGPRRQSGEPLPAPGAQPKKRRRWLR